MHAFYIRQAHINVIQSNRRPQPAQANVSTVTTGTSTAATTTTAASGEANGTGLANQSSTNIAATAEANSNGQRPQGGQPSALAGRNTTPPTVNINIQPDLSYQVEIETRVPIALPIENAILQGLTNATDAVNQIQNQHQQNQTQNQSGPQGQANRRQVLFGKIYNITRRRSRFQVLWIYCRQR